MSIFWISVAAGGFILLACGLSMLYRRYRRGLIDGVQFTASLVACVSFTAFAVTEAFRPDLAGGRAALGILAPAFVAVVILVRKRWPDH